MHWKFKVGIICVGDLGRGYHTKHVLVLTLVIYIFLILNVDSSLSKIKKKGGNSKVSIAHNIFYVIFFSDPNMQCSYIY